MWTVSYGKKIDDKIYKYNDSEKNTLTYSVQMKLSHFGTIYMYRN